MLTHRFLNPQKPSRVVLIGGAGFIGQALSRRLARDQIEVCSLGRAQIDLLAPDAAIRLRRVVQAGDSVVMIAAKAPAKTTQLLSDNIQMAQAVCLGLASMDLAHFLYISSDAVYADDARPVNEQSARAPSTLHGVMHLAREIMFEAGISAPKAFLRPTLIYGPGDPHNGYGPNRFAREAKAGGPVQYFGEGEEKRDHIFIDDVADLAALILCHQSTGALNAATGIVTSFGDIARMIAEKAGVEVKSIPRPGPRPHLLHRHFDVMNLRTEFPKIRLHTIRSTLMQSGSSSVNG
jgi:nucleoside-diphosphate-sugar epimerase